MAVAYRSSSASPTPAGVDSQSTSRSILLPAGAAVDDIMVLPLELNAGNPTVTYPSGWVEKLVSSNAPDLSMKVAWKRLTSGDISTGSVNMTWTGSQFNQAQAILLTGAITTGDPFEVTNTAQADSVTAVPSVSATSTIAVFWLHFAALTNFRVSTAPTGYTRVQDANYLDTSYRVAASPGLETASGGTVATSTDHVVALLAVLPASGSSFSGSVALSGAGTLTNAGTPGHKGTVALSGSGTLTETGKPAVAGPVALAGAGQLAGTGSPATAGALGLSGAGTASDTGSPAVSGSTALAGAGTLAETGAPATSGTAALGGSGTITSAGQPMLPGNLSLTGGGTLTGAAGNDYSGTVALAGSGALGLNGKPATQGGLNLAGAGSLATVGTPGHAGSVQFSGVGKLAKAGFGPAVQSVLTAGNAPSSALTPEPRPVLTPSNAPSSHLEVSHGV